MARSTEPSLASASRAISSALSNGPLPSIPLSHSPPAIVTSPRVQGLVTSPLTAEEFASVSVSEQ